MRRGWWKLPVLAVAGCLAYVELRGHLPGAASLGAVLRHAGPWWLVAAAQPAGVGRSGRLTTVAELGRRRRRRSRRSPTRRGRLSSQAAASAISWGVGEAGGRHLPRHRAAPPGRAGRRRSAEMRLRYGATGRPEHRYRRPALPDYPEVS